MGARRSPAQALDQLERLLDAELERSHRGAAARCAKGSRETLTLTRLGITGSLKRTLASDEPVRVDDRVRPPHQPQRQALASGEMALRWTAAGMLEAERQFRKIIGYRELARLAVAIERDLARTTVRSPTEEAGGAQRRAPAAPFAPANAGGGDRGG